MTVEAGGFYSPLRDHLFNERSRLLPPEKQFDPGEFLAEFKTRVNFQENDSALRVLIGDMTSHIKRIGEDKYSREERKGHTESAAYGLAESDGRQFVLYTMHWPYWAGTLGVVAGEKFVKAAKLAIDKKVPLFSIFSSAGARQEEGLAALVQMPRIVYATEKLKERNIPHIAAVIGQAWGGISASGLTAADFTLIHEGASNGFAGPRVIENYTCQAVPPGAQSAEAQVERRNLDMIISTEDIYDWLREFLKTRESRKISTDELSAITSIHHFDVVPPLTHRNYKEALKENTDGEELYERYRKLLQSPDRLDTVRILRGIFTDFVPLFNVTSESEDLIIYPVIIAALGKIGPQSVLILGNQPSYQKRPDGTVVKIPANPGPADFEYMQRMLKFGKKLGNPLVYFCDTPGAKPTLEAEQADQSRKIQESIAAANTYPHPTISIVTGFLGSGGGIVSPIADNIAALSEALLCVAEPASAASILDKTTSPTKEQVVEKIINLGMLPHNALRDKLIDAVIPESDYPSITMVRIRNYLADTLYELGQRSKRNLYHRRDERMMNGFRGRPLQGTR